MNEEVIQDLKQFIQATTSQSEQRMMERMDGMDKRFEQIDRRFDHIDRRFEQVDQRFEDIVDGMNQQTETIIDHFDKASTSSSARIDDHEERISRLERHAA